MVRLMSLEGAGKMNVENAHKLSRTRNDPRKSWLRISLALGSSSGQVLIHVAGDASPGAALVGRRACEGAISW